MKMMLGLGALGAAKAPSVRALSSATPKIRVWFMS
jgi:hypothetical protein